MLRANEAIRASFWNNDSNNVKSSDYWLMQTERHDRAVYFIDQNYHLKRAFDNLMFA